MKHILATIFVLFLYGCVSHPIESEVQRAAQPCLGSLDLPEFLAAKFDPVEDDRLIDKALGKPNMGKLCQGRVYKSKENSRVLVFRAWNSTNQGSEFGNWWVFQKPSGKISTYRHEYEICYQWSPIDKLSSCTLKPGVKIVLGTGQSAKCSDHLTNPSSPKQQIFIEDSSLLLINCRIFDGEFSWK